MFVYFTKLIYALMRYHICISINYVMPSESFSGELLVYFAPYFLGKIKWTIWNF